jgi:hypothetical protein
MVLHYVTVLGNVAISRQARLVICRSASLLRPHDTFRTLAMHRLNTSSKTMKCNAVIQGYLWPYSLGTPVSFSTSLPSSGVTLLPSERTRTIEIERACFHKDKNRHGDVQGRTQKANIVRIDHANKRTTSYEGINVCDRVRF